MRGKSIAVLIFLLLVVVEGVLPLGDVFKDLTWGVRKYFISLRGYLEALKECVVSVRGATRTTPPIFSIVEIHDGIVMVKGKGKKGDYVIGSDGVIVGRVEKTVNGWILVKTPLSDDFRLKVSVIGDGVEAEGELHGGNPPVVSIPEELDVTGWEVFISRGEELGEYLRSEGIGRVGKIAGRLGSGWAVDYSIPTGGAVVVGK